MITAKRLSASGIVWLATLYGIFSGSPLLGQMIESKGASVSAPQALPQGVLAAALLPTPNAEALFNRKQQRLRDHHRPIPIGPRPPGVQAMVKPPAEAASSVATVLAPLAESQIDLMINRALTDTETANSTSTVSEPSIAVRGEEVLLTANWFASFSRDGGATFRFLNPATTFPSSPQGAFCCDQVAIFDKQHDLMIWLLQYINNSSGNTLRVAVARGEDIVNRRWRYYDFSPQSVGNWKAEWFDYPDAVLGEKFLYVSSNVFGATSDLFTRAVMLRLPLDKLAAYEAFDYRYYDTDELGGLRATSGASDTMYFAAHVNLAKMRVFTWPEASNSLAQKDVTVQVWSDDSRVAPGPDGRDWLGRADGRITAAWKSGDQIGFGWTAAQDEQFAFPHVRVAIVNRNTAAIISEPHIWNPQFAFAYPAAAANTVAKVGLAVHYGGGNLHPSHAVGALAADNSWNLVTSASGRFGPEDNRWGDYGGVRADPVDSQAWVATGYTLQTGSLRTDTEVRYIRFKVREGDNP